MTQVVSIHGNRATQSLRNWFGPVELLNNLPVGVCCCDVEGVLVQFNRHAVELWGREPELGVQRYGGAERIYAFDGELIPSDYGPIAKVLRTGMAVRNESIVIERADGSRIKLLVNVEPLHDDVGDLVGAVACFQDVTGLSTGHVDDLEDFFENAPIGLHIVSGDGIVLRANRAELELLGYSRKEYVGRHVAEFHADEQVIHDILARLSRGEAVDRYPARLRAKDGSIRHVLMTSNAQLRDGDLVRTRCFTLDVTAAKLAEDRERESELRSRAALESMPVAIYATDAEGRVTFYNEACAELAGSRPEIGSDQRSVPWRLYTPEGEPVSPDECPMADVLTEGRAVPGTEILIERPDGTRARVLPHPTPLFDANGRLTGAVNVLVDITDRHETDVQLARLAAIVKSSDDAIISKSLDGRITSWNAGATRIYGYEEHEVLGKLITIVIPAELQDEELGILAKLRRGERIEHYETVRVTKDGRRIDVSLTISPIRDRLGRIVGASKVSRDITEQKRHQEVQELLIRELNHRVKNTLATVQSIATQTVRSANSPSEFMAGFTGRLQSLARAHTVLTRGNWLGVDVEELIRDQLLLGGADDEQISYSGPPVVLEPQAALHLALVLHELGTNARKYGALSTPTGRLTLRWVVRSGGGQSLLLHWKEQDGPPVEKPSRSGFGSTLIQQSLGAQGGAVSIGYPVDGVTCEIRLPLPDAVGSVMPAGRAPVPAARSRTGRGGAPARSPPERKTRVLVVEDEPLVAMDVTVTLSDAGCEVIGPAATLDKAKELIDAGHFEVALLDANLAGEPVTDLADELSRRNIPFAFLTGYGREGMPQEFRTAPLIDKPFSPKQLIAVIGELVALKA